MDVPVKQVALLAIVVLVACRPFPCLARHPPARLAWADHPDGMDDGAQQAGCFSGSCATSVGAGGLEGDLDLDDAQQVDPLSVDKRTTSLQDMCNSIAESRGIAWLRTAMMSCRCELGYRPLQLGQSHFPHNLNVMTCRQSPRCVTKSYPVPLLIRRSSGSGAGPKTASEQDVPADDEATVVPESIRKHWRLEYKNIPVGCDCVP